MTAVRKELSRRRKPLWFATMLVALAATVVFVIGSSANLTGSTFEGKDGNLVVNTAGNKDWDNAPNLVTAQDLATGQGDNSFGQGTKEDNVNVTVVTGSIPNSKADLARFAVASEFVNNKNFLYLAWSRENSSGTVNFDIELNQAAQPDLTTPGAKVLNRTSGDLLINYSFQGGSNTPTLTKRSWNGTAWGPESVISSANSEGATNSATVSENLGGRPAVNRPPQQFGEAAINLTDAGVFPPGTCEAFGDAYIKSRSSVSFTSEIKDFIAPIPINISNCATVIIRKQTNPDGATQLLDYTKSFPTSPSTPNTFQLADNGVKTFTGVTLGSGYTVVEGGPPPGWSFNHLDCSASTGVSPTVNGATATFSVD